MYEVFYGTLLSVKYSPIDLLTGLEGLLFILNLLLQVIMGSQ